MTSPTQIPPGGYIDGDTIGGAGSIDKPFTAMGGAGVGPGTAGALAMFTSPMTVGDAPAIVDTTSAATPIIHATRNLSVGTPGVPDPGGGNPDGSPFYASDAGHLQVNKVDVTSTGGGALEVWGGAKINDNLLFGNRNDADQTVLINQFGFASAGTRWRSLHVYDGKGSPIVAFDAPSKLTQFFGPLARLPNDVGHATDRHVFTVDDTSTYDTSGPVNLTAFGLDIIMQGVNAGGGGSLENRALYADAFGGDSNYSLMTVRGNIFLGKDFQMAFTYVNTAGFHVSGAGKIQGDFFVGVSDFGGTQQFKASSTTGRVDIGDVGSNLMASIFTGLGSPEGVQAATIGSMWLRTDGGVGTTLYVKELNSGGNTGWFPK